MIKNITDKQLSTLKLNIYLKDGRNFLGCDTTLQPFGEKYEIVTFWQDESVRIFPMSAVEEIVMIFD